MPESPGVNPASDPPASARRRVDRILDPTYVEALDRRAIDDLRLMRAECGEVETEVSYVRRLAQARLDIIAAELKRREDGGDLGDLIASLPEILAGDTPRTGVAAARIAQPLRGTAEQLKELEHEVSEVRHSLHSVMDQLEAELGERLRPTQAT
jgi:Mg2+ and Co2+ transporter CorA